MYTARPPIALSKRLLLTFAALLVLVLLTATLAGCSVPVSVGEPVPPAQPSSAPTDTPLLAGSLGAMAPVSIFEGEEAKSLEEAQSRVDFQVAVPGVAPGDYKLIWIGTSPLSNKGELEGQFVRLVYSDGEHYILVGQGPSGPPNPATLTDDALARIHSQRITVRDYIGRGHGAITVETPVAVVDGKTITTTMQVPAFIRWWPTGLLRAIWTSDDLSITLEDLIAMAESMEPAQ